MRTGNAEVGEMIQKRLMQRARDGEGMRGALTRRLGKGRGLALGGPLGQAEALASDEESFRAEQRWRRGHQLTGMQEERIAEEKADLLGRAAEQKQEIAEPAAQAPVSNAVSPAQRAAFKKARWDQTMKLGAALQAGRAKGSGIGSEDFAAMDKAREGFDTLGKGPLGMAAGGPVFDAREGGAVPLGPEGIDQVPAMTSDGEVMLDGPSEERAEGEYVLTPEMIEALGGVERLEALREVLAGEREAELAERGGEEGEGEGYFDGGEIRRDLVEPDASWQKPLREQREAAVAGVVPELSDQTVAKEYLGPARAGAQAHQKRVEEEGGMAKVQRRVLARMMAGAQLPVVARAQEVRAEVERENGRRGPQSLRQTAPQVDLAPVPLAEDATAENREYTLKKGESAAKIAHDEAAAEASRAAADASRAGRGSFVYKEKDEDGVENEYRIPESVAKDPKAMQEMLRSIRGEDAVPPETAPPPPPAAAAPPKLVQSKLAYIKTMPDSPTRKQAIARFVKEHPEYAQLVGALQ